MGPWDKPVVVPGATGPKSLCLCAFFLPDMRHGWNGKSARCFSAHFLLLHPPGVTHVRAFGSWMFAPKCLFFQGFEACPKFLTRGVRTNDPGTSAGYPARKLSLWAVISFLNLDGPAIRNVNRGDWRESTRRKKTCFLTCRAIHANRLKPAIRNF